MSIGNLSIVEINFAEANILIQRCAVNPIDRSKTPPEKLFLLFIGDRLVGVFLTVKEAYERWSEIRKLEVELEDGNEISQTFLNIYIKNVLPEDVKVTVGNDRRVGLIKVDVK